MELRLVSRQLFSRRIFPQRLSAQTLNSDSRIQKKKCFNRQTFVSFSGGVPSSVSQDVKSATWPLPSRTKTRRRRRQMALIPRTNQARPLGEDGGALCLHKQAIITMMNGCAQTLAAPSSSSSSSPAYQYETHHQTAARRFLPPPLDSPSN